MQNLLTADDLYAYVRMLLADKSRCVVVFEGPDDCGALEPFLDKSTATAVCGNGKLSCVRVFELIRSDDVDDVVIVLDKDFDFDLNRQISDCRVAYTDHYDLDATLFFMSDSVGRVVSNVASAGSVAKVLRERGHHSPVDACMADAKVVGAARLVSVRDGLELAMDKFPIHEVAKNGQPSEDDVAHLAIKRSGTSVLHASDLAQRMVTVNAGVADARSLCCGHDLIAAFVNLLQLSGCPATTVGRRGIGNMLRIGFSHAEISQTSVWRAVADWALQRNRTVWAE